ncbi:4-hydroxybenzoate transporter PcaK [Pseudoruegeria aquimaris]|uniref:4-hydroxybenzoate transporter PcaK n=1 Tax=Pseudoruegeria aquimaris TaxID=393663 RepID=A0A1Y5RA61_9RHOB|nr:MFS transporter [Pseudoruegeria aquimaris]SLN12594.1 4-hydroxybenzoate transporter PcaK [Pseudoruegeria aquimaris]
MARVVLLLTLTVGVIGSNSLVLSPIAGAVAAGLGADSAAGVMIAAGVYGLGVALAALLIAPQADRIGADRALLGATVALAAGLALSALAVNVATLSVAQALAGIGAGVGLPAAYSLAAHVAPKGQESRVIGRVLAGWTLSMVGGVTLSAFLAELAGWRAVYALLAAMTLLCVFALARLRLTVPAPRGTPTRPATALRIPGVRPGLYAVAMLGTGFYVIYTFLGAHLDVALARPVRDSGLITLFYGAGFASAMILDPLLDRTGPRRGLAIVFSLLAVFYALFASQMGHYAALPGFAFVWGVLQHLGLNLTVSRLTAIAPAQRGAIMGLNSTVMYLSVFAASLAGERLFALGGLPLCALVAAGLAVLGLCETLWARRQALRSGSPAGPSAPPCAPDAPLSGRS